MPIPSTGPVSLANIQTEYGGANPISLSEYYRGGSLVSSGSSTSIPTSGTISLANFRGTSAAPAFTATLTTKTVLSQVFTAQDSSSFAGIGLGATGKLMAFANEIANDWFEISPANEWLDPEGGASAAEFEARLTTSPPGLVTNTDSTLGYTPTVWKRLGPTANGGEGFMRWYIANSDPDTLLTVDFTIEIRRISTGVVTASAPISLRARLRNGAPV